MLDGCVQPHPADGHHWNVYRPSRTYMGACAGAVVPAQMQHASASVAGNSNLKVCQFCSKTYRDPKAFARHVSTAHPVTNDVKALQSVICDECNHEFSNAYMLNKHQATCCSETRCFPCKKCDTFWNSGMSSFVMSFVTFLSQFHDFLSQNCDFFCHKTAFSQYQLL